MTEHDSALADLARELARRREVAIRTMVDRHYWPNCPADEEVLGYLQQATGIRLTILHGHGCPTAIVATRGMVIIDRLTLPSFPSPTP